MQMRPGNLISEIYNVGSLGDSMPRRVTEVPNQLSWQITYRVSCYNLAVARQIKGGKCFSIFPFVDKGALEKLIWIVVTYSICLTYSSLNVNDSTWGTGTRIDYKSGCRAKSQRSLITFIYGNLEEQLRTITTEMARSPPKFVVAARRPDQNSESPGDQTRATHPTYQRPGTEGAMAECREGLVESGRAEDMPRVVSALAGILERVAERNDAAAAAAELSVAPASAFRATAKPGISVRAYTARIARFAGCSHACYVVAYVYLDRLLRRGRRRGLAVDSYSVHRLLITAVLAAVKFMDDIFYNNAYFAKVGGISLVEMNYLELDFLFGIGFDLNVTPETFGDYCAALQSEMLCAEAPPAPPRLQYCCVPEDDAAGASSSQSQQQQLAA